MFPYEFIIISLLQYIQNLTDDIIGMIIEICIKKESYSMLKRVGIFSLIGLILLNLVGCTGGSYTITVGEIDTQQNVMSGEYKSFSGHYFKKVKLEDRQTLKVTFSGDTEKGEIIAKVIDSDGNTSKTLKSGNTVTIFEPGHYKLQVEGKEHKGHFTLSWKIE
ncbi:hypothetical protein RCG19_23170 [Neobacillus sp. OS1-2]|uniref:hypothetical protein n=1 Tax=Neobacillus sp. OS1-2 TaxID=3070680 RepID=UPI0027DEE9CD|nr:hypothetical protein [Neobacillus sp. OS1-2]WML40029.1 hypothetical protein RCG19_23170 [Neobacillus sp. OS1-2]